LPFWAEEEHVPPSGEQPVLDVPVEVERRVHPDGAIREPGVEERVVLLGPEVGAQGIVGCREGVERRFGALELSDTVPEDGRVELEVTPGGAGVGFDVSTAQNF
jgi:hypothetical protein